MENNSKELSIQNTIVGNKISWSAVIAGLITFLVIFIMLTILSVAIGFGAAGNNVNNTLDSLGVGVTILTVTTFLC